MDNSTEYSASISSRTITVICIAGLAAVSGLVINISLLVKMYNEMNAWKGALHVLLYFVAISDLLQAVFGPLVTILYILGQPIVFHSYTYCVTLFVLVKISSSLFQACIQLVYFLQAWNSKLTQKLVGLEAVIFAVPLILGLAGMVSQWPYKLGSVTVVEDIVFDYQSTFYQVSVVVATSGVLTLTSVMLIVENIMLWLKCVSGAPRKAANASVRSKGPTVESQARVNRRGLGLGLGLGLAKRQKTTKHVARSRSISLPNIQSVCEMQGSNITAPKPVDHFIPRRPSQHNKVTRRQTSTKLKVKRSMTTSFDIQLRSLKPQTSQSFGIRSNLPSKHQTDAKTEIDDGNKRHRFISGPPTVESTSYSRQRSRVPYRTRVKSCGDMLSNEAASKIILPVSFYVRRTVVTLVFLMVTLYSGTHCISYYFEHTIPSYMNAQFLSMLLSNFQCVFNPLYNILVYNRLLTLFRHWKRNDQARGTFT